MGSRHAPPVFVADDGLLTALTRLELGRGEEDGKRRDAFIQDLVHAHPEVIPMADIEPAMSPLLPVCRELPVAGYFVDNLWITPRGGLVVGECKLVRNPQARREVVALVLDYGPPHGGLVVRGPGGRRRAGARDLQGHSRCPESRGIRTARGGQWHASTVLNILKRGDG